MRRSSGVLILVFAAVLMGSLLFGGWRAGESLMLSQTISEGRTVADMAENVGRWASQYGGVHVRTQGATAKLPGTFLTRSVFALSGDDASVLNGARTQDRQDERGAMERVEAYHWKNPALIQREVSDTLAASGSRSQYRLTAQSVLNRNNAPNAFEVEAIKAIQASFDKLPPAVTQAVAKGDMSTLPPQEYWRVENGRLLYARAVMAQSSCLKCHDSPNTAPAFLRTNEQFNGGGGFGYVAGKPAGVISVTVPLQDVGGVLQAGLPPIVIAAFAVAALAALGLIGVALGGLFRQPSKKK
ncbi:DUF3365 domain-containing protein [Aquabacterium sp.]|uniref:c-type heme family protein n=1 Tax=Aquabacterium sp. TaxID=1872578 RepID=UPI0025BB11F3|nr:DUF3365 domain-containing protein [Aquabacterium sp.]